MKKIIQSAILSVLVMLGLNAQAQYDKGDNLLNVGLNIGTGLGAGAAYEVGFHEFISAGGEFNYTSWGSAGYRINLMTFGARGSYHVGKHFIENDQIDFYAGLGIGYRLFNDNIGFLNSYANGVYFSPFLGIRYYFKPNMAALAEGGYQTGSALKVGITLKM